MPSQPAARGKPLVAGALALAIGVAALFEGLSLPTYSDPVGIPTRCYGSTDARVVNDPREWTEAECRELLTAELLEHWDGVSRCITVPMKPHEAAAVLSWAFNVGVGAACKSTLVSMLNSGAPAALWCAQLSRWVYAGGKFYRGLQRRREAERALCEGR